MALETAVAATKRGSKDIKTHVLLVSVVRRQSVLGYAPASRNVLQIMMAGPQLVATARTVLERGFRCPGFSERQFQTYESNVPFELRYMVDNDIVGCNWLELPPQVRLANRSARKLEANKHARGALFACRRTSSCSGPQRAAKPSTMSCMTASSHTRPRRRRNGVASRRCACSALTLSAWAAAASSPIPSSTR